MARSRKMKSSQKLRKNRKQRGGGIDYDKFLQEAKEDVFEAQKNYYPTTDDYYGSSFLAKAEDPIAIPGFGMYIGKYYLYNYKITMSGTGMLTSFEKDEKTGLPRFIKKGDWKNNKENGYFVILYGNGDVVSSVHMEKGSVLPSLTEERRKGEGDIVSQYTYSNGQVYVGDLILKNGKIVPENDSTPPRTVFNFAPGPTVVFTGEEKTIEIPPAEAERGFLMSQDPDFVPTVPPNSPRDEPVVVRRGLGLKGRLSGIRDSRTTAVTPMNRKDELRQMRELTASQTAMKPLPSLERKSVIPSITRRGGKYRRSGKKTKKTRRARV